MSGASRKAQTVVLAVNPDELSDVIADKVARRLEVTYGRRLQADGKQAGRFRNQPPPLR